MTAADNRPSPPDVALIIGDFVALQELGQLVLEGDTAMVAMVSGCSMP